MISTYSIIYTYDGTKCAIQASQKLLLSQDCLVPWDYHSASPGLEKNYGTDLGDFSRH